jgi:hypothetical protein
MSLAQSILKFIAARFHIPADALDYYFASSHIGRGAETLLPFPAELIPIGARLVTRGWFNNKFFPSNRDWILPYWANRQFDPTDPAFMPRGMNLYTINYTHRDWTMLGNPARAREAIVDPRGLVTPWFDGWSLDVWCAIDDKFYAPSRLPAPAVEQSLHDNLPIVVTTFTAGNVQIRLETFAAEQNNDEFVLEQITVQNLSRFTHHATLYLAIRPFNPEGIALVKDIDYQPVSAFEESAMILINRAPGVYLPPPDAIASSNFDNGDVALALPALNGKTQVHCPAGLATAVAAYNIELNAGESTALTVAMPMTHQLVDEDSLPNRQSQTANRKFQTSNLRTQTISTWQAILERGMRVRVPDEKIQAAYDANKAYLLLLHDGDTLTPGPWTYHQFWMRDAAYMLNALDKLGYHAEAQQVLEKIPRYLQKDGYLRITEGEWDTNGAALWSFVEHTRLTGDLDLLARNYWSMLKMAAWINSKRQQTKNRRPSSVVAGHAPHHGLLPSGMSAEHLGPTDYYYWDDWWGLAGLRAMRQTAEWLAQKADAEKLRANFESFQNDINVSLAQAAQRIGRAAMPASPYRRLDAGMIGNLAAWYPLQLFDANDPRLVATIAALKEIAWLEDAYFNHVGHSAFGTYLALHVAQCLLMQNDPAAWTIIDWVLQHASPTFTWAEGIHPITRGGAMGDGHHGWAIADWLLIVRNSLLLEREANLIITPAMPETWTEEMNVIKVQDAPTYFGKVNFAIAFGQRTGTLAINGEWRDDSLKQIEWHLPFPLREFGSDTPGVEMSGNSVRLPRDARRVVVMW